MPSPVLQRFKRKKLLVGLSKEDIAALPIAQRAGSLFTANNESIRLVERMQELLLSHLEGETETVIGPNEEKTKVKKVQGASDFVEKMRAFMDAEGISEPGMYSAENDRVTNIGARRRLQLIFDTQTRSAYSQGRWEKGMTPEMLNAYPAARFVRYPGATTKRIEHIFTEGAVRLKTDFTFWALEMNARSLGGFEVPWAPYGFNSYMDTQDVSFSEAVQLGLITKDWTAPAVDLSVFGASLPERVNAGLSASTKGLPENLKEKLRESMRELFGEDAIDKDGRVAFPAHEAAERAKREAARKEAENKTETPSQPVDEPKEPATYVGDKIITDGPGIGKKVREAVDAATRAIDKVHHDGPLPNAYIEQTRRSQSVGAFYPNLPEGRIDISSNNDTISLTAIHEIGHFIDLWGLGKGQITQRAYSSHEMELLKREHYASESHEDLAEWREAVTNSEAYKKLGDYYKRSHSYTSYLKLNRELFARSYAQFIAVESGDEKLIRELVKSRRNHKYQQWSSLDFRPIRQALKKLFTRKGWIK